MTSESKQIFIFVKGGSTSICNTERKEIAAEARNGWLGPSHNLVEIHTIEITRKRNRSEEPKETPAQDHALPLPAFGTGQKSNEQPPVKARKYVTPANKST